MQINDNVKVLFGFDRCIILNGSDVESAKKTLSRRLYTNKRIDIKFSEKQDTDYADFVTNMVISSYLDVCSKKEDYSFCELMYKDFSAKFYNTYIMDIPDIEKESEAYISKNPMYKENTLRINDNVDISVFKKENFDEKYGIISNIYKDLMSSDISIVGCEFHYKNELTFSYGREKDFVAAEKSAILELIERIAIYEVYGNIITTSYEDGKQYNLVNPEELLFYSDEFRERGNRFDKKQVYKWLEVEEYLENKKAWIPLQFFSMDVNDEPLFVFESSNGVALGSSIYEAKLFALFEFVERDAFLNFWYKKARLYIIDINSISNSVREKIARFETENKKVYLFDMTFDVTIPCILCLVVDYEGKVATYISTACHVNYNIAINAAVNECLVGHRIYENNQKIGEKKYNSDNDIVKMFDHVSHASQRQYIKNYDFLFESEMKSVDELYNTDEYKLDASINNAKDLLEYLCREKLNNQGKIFFADLTTKLSYRYGFYIAKIIVSDMLPMTFGYANQRINHERISRAIRNSKYAERCLCKGDEIDDRAHPFP
ncbi:MAG: YcaO-like family protein [Coprococcus sp.]